MQSAPLAWTRRQYPIAVGVIVAYLVLSWISQSLLLHPSTLFPASAVALATLFLEGLTLWPAIYIAALLGQIIGGAPLAFILIMPIAQTLQAAAGAFLMRRGGLDPLFRRSRDIFLMVGTIVLVAAIVPALGSLASSLSVTLSGASVPLPEWSLRYTGMLFCLLILTPFVLRWFAKGRFSRTGKEIIETAAVFAILIILGTAAFLVDAPLLGGIPTIYFMLLPLCWIAVRLRPRFVTLAMLLVSILAIAGLYISPTAPSPALFSDALFQTEEFLIVIALIFYIIVSLEENARLSTNLVRSQVATLENVIAQISTESNAKNDFISILGHELRNPLAPVVTAIEFLRTKEARDPEEAELLTMMDDRMRTVRRLLDDLLNISRISEGKIALKRARVDLETVVKRAIVSTEHHLRDRHQSLSFKPWGKPMTVYGDPVRIEQIFSNLLTNASKYSNTGDEICLIIRKNDDEAEVVVRDDGIGIDPTVLQKIFTPFYQAEVNSRSKRGLGIGLALVKSFTEMHGGRVIASSRGVGLGSEFVVRLPLVPREVPLDLPDATETAPAAPSTSAEPPPQAKYGPRVLVVDDNDAAAWGIGRLLELKGCRVTYAYDGGQALEKARLVKPEIVLLDVGLPDQDGYTVARALRAGGYRGRLIALTGFSTDEARTQGEEAGFDHYLIKPAGFADLQRVIPELG
jgi:signal transduction histidine kinase/CheY-like chemotaxis protein